MAYISVCWYAWSLKIEYEKGNILPRFLGSKCYHDNNEDHSEEHLHTWYLPPFRVTSVVLVN